MEYTVDYFIEKFSGLNNWRTGSLSDKEGNHCVLGHCGVVTVRFDGNSAGYVLNEEANALGSLFGVLPGRFAATPDYYEVIRVNDGTNPFYPENTPKERVLAALHDIKAILEKRNEDALVEEVKAIINQEREALVLEEV